MEDKRTERGQREGYKQRIRKGDEGEKCLDFLMTNRDAGLVTLVCCNFGRVSCVMLTH